MMGRLVVQEALFYQLRLEDFIPPDHLLRRIDQVLCFDDIRCALNLVSPHRRRSARSRHRPGRGRDPRGHLLHAAGHRGKRGSDGV